MKDTDEKNEKASTDVNVVEKSDSKKHKKSQSKKKKKKKIKGADETSQETAPDTLEVTQESDEVVETTSSDNNNNDDAADNKEDENAESKKSKKSKKKKKKKEKATKSIESDGQTETKNAVNDQKNDDNDSDDELLAAAAMWAGDEGDSAEEEPAAATNRLPTPQNLSLHITQLPYDSTEFDLRKLFAEQGCSITSIRLVYDHDTEGRKTVFRGVAFCDFLDVTSYHNALKLHHKSSIRGRKLNIRPCKSREELAAIVARTQDLVREKIHQQLSGKDITKSTSSLPKPANNRSPKSKQSGTKRKNNDQKDKKNKKPRMDKDGKPIKLTKKERNRRAAIIMQKRRRQNK